MEYIKQLYSFSQTEEGQELIKEIVTSPPGQLANVSGVILATSLLAVSVKEDYETKENGRLSRTVINLTMVLMLSLTTSSIAYLFGEKEAIGYGLVFGAMLGFFCKKSSKWNALVHKRRTKRAGSPWNDDSVFLSYIFQLLCPFYNKNQKLHLSSILRQDGLNYSNS